MRGCSLVAILLAGVPCGASASQSQVTPVQKVVQLLQGMLIKAKNEKHEEAMQFARYEKWCEGITSEKEQGIKKAGGLIESLTADVQKFKADLARLGGEIMTHGSDIDGWGKDRAAAKEIFETERAEYIKTHADYTESINALTQAMMELKQKARDTPGAAALFQQVEDLKIPDKSRKMIKAFLDRGEDDVLSAPAANAYEFKSDTIITMLEGLKDKFREKKQELEKDQVARRFAWDTLRQDLGQSIEASENELADDTETVASRKQKIAESQELLDDTTATRTEDQKYLDDTSVICKQKSDDFAARQKLRGDEMDALDKAVEILSGDAVSGSADKHLPALMQKLHKNTVLAQIRGSANNMPDNQLRAAAFLRDQADVLGSRVLSAIAMKAGADPFVKVKKLIAELIERLMQESTQEASHKGWCDTELGTNAHTRKSKTVEVEKLNAEIEGLQSKIETLAKDLNELSTAVAELNAAVSDQTDMRNAEKAENKKTIEDAVAGVSALENAVNVLKEFYGKAGEAKALIQQRNRLRDEPPEIFDEPYQGQKAGNSGVMGMLDVIKSDFQRLEQDTKSAEAGSQSQYDEFMSDTAIDEAAKKRSIEHKKRDKHESEMTLDETKSGLESSQMQLDAAKASFEKLKPACVDVGMSYQERVKRRRDEVESLQEALRILSGDDLTALNQE